MTIEQINRKIKENNRLFKAATKAEKRVMIAKDALASLKSNQYKASMGIWVTATDRDIQKIRHSAELYQGEQEDINSCSIQPAIVGGLKCQCCAIGSLMFSTTKYNNEATILDINYYYENGPFSSKIFRPSKKNLGIRKFFSLKQLKLIESVYEEGDGWCKDRTPSGIKFYEKYPNMRQRMIAILKNIIKNNGTFKP